MLILNAQDVRKALPMGECVEAMKQAYAALSSGAAEVPLRTRLAVKPHEGMSILMPAFVDDANGQSLAIKLVSFFTKNPARGLPLIHAVVLVFNPETGALEAILEGGTVTAIRTGAGCGAATDLLANPDAKTVAIFGAGVQARTQLEAVCAVRQIETAWVYSPNAEHVQKFIHDLAGHGAIPKDLRAAASAQEAVHQADIISAASTSHTPVFDNADVKTGAHINAAGTHTAEGIEIPIETIARARITVDSRSATAVESGEIAMPLAQNLIKQSDIAEIGEVVLARAAGRSSAEQITFFKSVGVAVQDAVAGRLAVENARKLGLGTEVDWP
jgi:ornithine cyclodeaminase/alanine dehydrogenase-like protein (mu-crystallin family)